MNIQAIWENGVFRPLQPIAVRHTILTIIVADEEILFAQPDKPIPVTELRQKINEILEPYRLQMKPDTAMSPQETKKIWHEHLEEKYLGTR
jgi:predicted DNA-binding antitoxin AbrB/MazE fold protein